MSIVDRIANGEIDVYEYAAQMRDFLHELGYDDAYKMGPVVAGLIAEQNGFRYVDPIVHDLEALAEEEL